MATPSLDEFITEIDCWFDDTLKRDAIAREVGCYNQAHAALHELKDRVAKMMTGKPLTPPAPPEEPAATDEAASGAEKAATAEAKPKPA